MIQLAARVLETASDVSALSAQFLFHPQGGVWGTHQCVQQFSARRHEVTVTEHRMWGSRQRVNSRQHSNICDFLCCAMNCDHIYIYHCRYSKKCDKSV